MAASDGTLLNFASELAATAAQLQKAHTARASKATDPTLVRALDDVKAAIGSLASAVEGLAGSVKDEDGDG